MKKYVLSILVLSLVACGKSGGSGDASAAGSPDPGPVAPPPDSHILGPTISDLRGMWTSKQDNNGEYYFCNSGGTNCAKSSAMPSACTNHWPSLGGNGVFGSGIEFKDSTIDISANTETPAFGTNSVTLYPDNVTYGVVIGTGGEIYVTYFPGCTIIFEVRN